MVLEWWHTNTKANFYDGGLVNDKTKEYVIRFVLFWEYKLHKSRLNKIMFKS